MEVDSATFIHIFYSMSLQVIGPLIYVCYKVVGITKVKRQMMDAESPAVQQDLSAQKLLQCLSKGICKMWNVEDPVTLNQ